MGGVKNSTTAQRVTAHRVDVAPRPRIRQARVDSISPSLDPSDWAWTVFTNHNDRPLTWSRQRCWREMTPMLMVPSELFVCWCIVGDRPIDQHFERLSLVDTKEIEWVAIWEQLHTTRKRSYVVRSGICREPFFRHLVKKVLPRVVKKMLAE
jgi:hypothetical protein